MQTLLLYESKIPIIVEDSELIPNFISEKTFILAILSSSQNENMIKKIKNCVQRGAEILFIAEEGTNLNDIQRENINLLSIPVNNIYYLNNHYVLISILFYLYRKNLINYFDFDNDLNETIGVLKYWREEYSIYNPTSLNAAKDLQLIYIILLYFYMEAMVQQIA